jgi:hypothetical protein
MANLFYFSPLDDDKTSGTPGRSSGSRITRAELKKMLAAYIARTQAAGIQDDTIAVVIPKKDLETLLSDNTAAVVAFFGLEDTQQTVILSPIDTNDNIMKNGTGGDDPIIVERWPRLLKFSQSLTNLTGDDKLDKFLDDIGV